MSDEAVLYYCDPEKNTECRKIYCGYLLELAEGGVCAATFDRRFAREYSDGTPMIYEKRGRRLTNGAESHDAGADLRDGQPENRRDSV